MYNSNSIYLRLFGLDGCPHCHQAITYLINRGIPFQYIPAFNDPVINQGIVSVTGQPSFPVLSIFKNNSCIEVLSGYLQNHYERVATDYIKSCIGAEPSKPNNNEVNNLGNTEKVAVENKQN